MIHRRSRVPAVMMLLAISAFTVGMFFARRSHANTNVNAEFARLQAAIARPDAKVEDWLQYGNALKNVQKYADAMPAFEQVLKMDPYNREARLGGAYCRAMLKDSTKLAQFLRETIQVDPKLAKNMFETQPVIAAYLSDPRFKTLQDDARAGSMD